MAETMAPQRVKRIMQYTPEQFCKVNKEQNIFETVRAKALLRQHIEIKPKIGELGFS